MGDVSTLSFENDYFDAVIESECLYANNSANLKMTLQEIKRVLKPHGMFYSRTFAKDMLSDVELSGNILEFERVKHGPLRDRGFARFVDREGIHSLYGDFKIISIDHERFTRFNASVLTSEYVIICQNENSI